MILGKRMPHRLLSTTEAKKSFAFDSVLSFARLRWSIAGNSIAKREKQQAKQ